MKKAIKAIGVLVAAALFLSASPIDYVSRLKNSEGIAYFTLDCARFVEVAHHAKHCSAAAMYTGCNGQATVVAEFATKSFDPSILRAGDVLDFHGAHVVAFVGDGFMDSDPSHSGVARISLRSKSASDLWFAGPVRVIRFN